MEGLLDKISSLGISIRENVSLSDYTTIKVGGPAKYFLEIRDSSHLISVLKILDQTKEKYFLLGKGSNIVVSDKGIDTFVIYNLTSHFKIDGEYKLPPKPRKIEPRYEAISNQEHKSKAFKVIVDSGVRMQYLMNKMFESNIVGLEYFSGIPCSMGGAIYMNLHGGDKFISEYITGAQLYSGGKIKTVDNSYFQFYYDYSILHKTKEIIIKAELALPAGNGDEAKKRAAHWAKKKSIQPKNSAGCVFKNISTHEKESFKLPTTSVGYIIDKLLGLKGYAIGGARVSPMHAAFIENYNNASAADIYALYKFIKSKAKEELKLELEPEIEFVGDF